MRIKNFFLNLTGVIFFNVIKDEGQNIIAVFYSRPKVPAGAEPVSPEPVQEPRPLPDQRRRPGLQLPLQARIFGQTLRAKHQRAERRRRFEKIQKKVSCCHQTFLKIVLSHLKLRRCSLGSRAYFEGTSQFVATLRGFD